ncbi:bifunctional diguanylate cyclase/phosphodiesterase [Aliivibrio kagoshimensis]|uniref:bifunctional diguanylate cyclase/phosphodiesterase n=1 Tax=Aliivibrio kagoshimensis TaxID=2910230 RepID=UPI003D13E4ED
MAMTRAPVRWQDTIQLRFTLGMMFFFITMIITIILVIHLIAKDILIENNRSLIRESGDHIVTELSRQLSVAETLTRSLARVGKNLPKDPSLMRNIIPEMLNLSGYQSFIAGGGIWPEPGLYVEGVERRSFFWGRDKQGKLKYFDQYNHPDGNGYHNEEWYVPARYSRQGQCVWSKSYTDPYSFEPMATCTVAMFDEFTFQGNATLDIKLSGLDRYLKKASASLGGYAFAVDRNNTFLSYPDKKMSKMFVRGENNTQIENFITAEELAKRSPEFKPFNNILQEINQNIVSLTSETEKQFSKQLADESYQISLSEASLIAANMSSLPNSTVLVPSQISQVLFQNDLILHEPVLVSVFLMPETLWKVIIVSPQRMATDSAQDVINLLIFSLVTMMCISGGIGFLFFRSRLIKPMYTVVSQLQQYRSNNSTTENKLLDDSRPDEFGLLAFHFNQSTIEISQNNRDLQRQIKEKKQVECQLRYLALHDPLTGLPNRTLFQDRLQQAVSMAKRGQHKFAVCFMDLDNFKMINDTLGHEVGDELLKRVSQRITQVEREVDTVARLGGDEFALIINKITCNDDVVNISQRIMESIHQPIKIDSNDIQIGTSIGITIYPDDALDAKKLLRNADIAMYQAKEDGRNITRFFVGEMNTLLQNRKQIQIDLQSSIANNDFELYYQPIFDIKTMELISFEALIRWHHPERGMIPPDQFIPIAEQSGLINELGTWVLNETCRQIKIFNQNGIFPSRIAVNISPVQFRRANFLEETLDILNTQGVASNLIELEITEGMVMHDVNQATVTMQNLSDAGFSLSIDDFGTGYSSLSYLKRFPIKKVKIDRSFITDLETDTDNRAITIAIIQMGHSLGLNVLAEGVESKAQLSFLEQQQCDLVQGYYSGKPMPASKVIQRFSPASDQGFTPLEPDGYSY